MNSTDDMILDMVFSIMWALAVFGLAGLISLFLPKSWQGWIIRKVRGE